jgi:hypothetical protein
MRDGMGSMGSDFSFVLKHNMCSCMVRVGVGVMEYLMFSGKNNEMFLYWILP